MKRLRKGIGIFLEDLRIAIPAILVFGLYSLLANFFLPRYCPFVLLTGLPCAGCGMTRAAILLFKGRIVESLVMHPMILSFVFYAMAYALFKYVLFIDTKSLKSLLVFILITTMVVYCVRMALVFPNQVPMVYYDENLLVRLLKAVLSK
ncbi:MAG TPA: DUF2752 domain-containing protein [Clostridiaceae bacterium]|nr:DUF2752 domain-containing protein [Clostridiaceae bacterium]